MGQVPRAADVGVRADRCGFGWNLGAALNNYGATRRAEAEIVPRLSEMVRDDPRSAEARRDVGLAGRAGLSPCVRPVRGVAEG